MTSNDVLRPAEATQACRDLGIEFYGYRLRSALDVDELMRDWNTALVAGFLRVAGRRASAAPDLPEAGSSAHRDPDAILDGWVQAATFFLDLDEDPCPGCLTVLHTLRMATGPVTMGQLAIAVREAEPEAYEDGEMVNDHAVDVVFGLLKFDAVSVGDEAVRLTQLGVLLAESVFDGRAVPPDADAATVISAITDLPPAVAPTIAAPWLSARSASGALRELLAFAESARGRDRLLAVAFAAELGPDTADEWREWAKRPGFGAYARAWLRSEGEVVTEEPADGAWIAADAFCVTVDVFAEEAPPFNLRDILAQQLGGDVSEAVKLIRRSGHHRAAELEAALTGRPVLTAVNGSVGGMLLYQLKITLRGVSKPPVWRRVLVPADISLNDLHGVIQQAMGWDDYHLHVFSVGWQEYGSPGSGLGHASDKKVRLSEVIGGPGARFRYTYDFGDDWEHDIVVEESRIAAPEETYPVCIAGKGACPPEDCGGVGGYAWLKEILASPAHAEHQNMLDWLRLDAGGDFDAKEFSVADVNSRLGGR